ncbi:MAG TPA: hypothetical protein DIW77_06880 [Chromatiaceae bacterium]|nr:hypothetical protein [Chromatiaceae bacterium]
MDLSALIPHQRQAAEQQLRDLGLSCTSDSTGDSTDLLLPRAVLLPRYGYPIRLRVARLAQT